MQESVIFGPLTNKYVTVSNYPGNKQWKFPIEKWRLTIKDILLSIVLE